MDRLRTSIRPSHAQNVHNPGPRCAWASPMFFGKNMNWAKGRQWKKKCTGTFVGLFNIFPWCVLARGKVRYWQLADSLPARYCLPCTASNGGPSKCGGEYLIHTYIKTKLSIWLCHHRDPTSPDCGTIVLDIACHVLQWGPLEVRRGVPNSYLYKN
jgi:hypothetical protein